MIEPLDDIKAGDRVIITHGGACRYDEIRVVDKVTNTQIIIGNSRFRRNGGSLIGAGTWDCVYLRHLTEEREKEFDLINKRRKLREILADVDKKSNTLPEEQVDELIDCLSKY